MANPNERVAALLRGINGGTGVHAALFSGPKGTGKREGAVWLASGVMGESDSKPCGVCPACRRVAEGQHIDVRFIEPEKNLIKVDTIRELINFLNMSAYEGGYRVAIIDGAECMNEQAQNALLKTLEEPGDRVVMLLLTTTPEALLPTVISRCRMVRFTPMSVEACAAELEKRGMTPSRARLLAGLGQGAVGEAERIDKDASYFELRDRVFAALKRLKDTASVLDAANEIGTFGKEDGDTVRPENVVLDILELWARDRMAIQNGGEVFQTDIIADLKASKIDGIKMLKLVMKARVSFRQHVNWTNILETMFFELVNGN
ncbi:MAG: DNA polymerase III subunit delta' [Clostridia bacterium]|nr:DNA polymerase III subunit delta' [Clostridia bacterium]